MPGEGAKHELRVVPCYVEAVFAWTKKTFFRRVDFLQTGRLSSDRSDSFEIRIYICLMSHLLLDNRLY